MKITRCATAVVEANYDYTYVRIHADNGVYGTGERFFAAGLTAALREMFHLLIGRDPREVDRLARLLWRQGSGAGAVAGYLYNAVSGIEAALWDLLGKSTGLPVYQFLGGKVRDQVRVNSSATKRTTARGQFDASTGDPFPDESEFAGRISA